MTGVGSPEAGANGSMSSNTQARILLRREVNRRSARSSGTNTEEQFYENYSLVTRNLNTTMIFSTSCFVSLICAMHDVFAIFSIIVQQLDFAFRSQTESRSAFPHSECFIDQPYIWRAKKHAAKCKEMKGAGGVARASTTQIGPRPQPNMPAKLNPLHSLTTILIPRALLISTTQWQ